MYGLISDRIIHSGLWDIPTSAYIAKYEVPPPPYSLGRGERRCYDIGKNKTKEMYVYTVYIKIM